MGWSIGLARSEKSYVPGRLTAASGRPECSSWTSRRGGVVRAAKRSKEKWQKEAERRKGGKAERRKGEGFMVEVLLRVGFGMQAKSNEVVICFDPHVLRR